MPKAPRRQRKCKVCRASYEPFNSLQKVCGVKCAKAFAEVDVRTKRENQWRKDKREHYRKDLSWQHKQTQKAFNRMRVLEELLWFQEERREPECTSCKKRNMDWCCGHFKTVGASGNLRYDKNNTWLQCNRYCNKGLSGNIEGNKTTRGYKQGLLERFGQKDGQEIIDYCDNHQADVKKWTWEEVEQIRRDCFERIRELNKILGK